MIQHSDESRQTLPHRATSRIRTDVTNAIMTGADLRGVDLRGVRGLTCRQVRSARIDRRTRLPLRLRLLCAWDRLTGNMSAPDGTAAVHQR